MLLSYWFASHSWLQNRVPLPNAGAYGRRTYSGGVLVAALRHTLLPSLSPFVRVQPHCCSFARSRRCRWDRSFVLIADLRSAKGRICHPIGAKRKRSTPEALTIRTSGYASGRKERKSAASLGRLHISLGVLRLSFGVGRHAVHLRLSGRLRQRPSPGWAEPEVSGRRRRLARGLLRGTPLSRYSIPSV